MRYRLLLLLLFMLSILPAQAGRKPYQFGLSGLSVFIDGGLLIPNDKQASFYDGRPERQNTILRLLHSPGVGNEIWSNLKTQGYLRGIGSCSEIEIAEYPSMYYRLTYQLGLGLRYDYDGGWGWLLRFDFSQVTANGVFLLKNKPEAGEMTNKGAYVNCAMAGAERRLYIDLALLKRFHLAGSFELELAAGFNLNNTKVQSQEMEIGGRQYSILDVWNGSTEIYPNIGTYEYINQGGLGIGGFGGIAISFVLPMVGTADVGYNCYYTQTVYKEFNQDDAFALQHVLFLRVGLSNFSFFG